MTKLALYPGTFDPITLGHLDVVRRTLGIFDSVVVGIAQNMGKTTTFSVEERLAMVQGSLAELGLEPSARAEVFSGLTVEFAAKLGATSIIRGIRAIGDFETEFQMTLMNRNLRHRIETVFLMPSEQYSYVSSSLVKEISALGGNVSNLVTACVLRALDTKLSRG
ncbi:MAG: pantetheine-phosphate adenylyltransferase [Candidatus Coatesbacteria bacterium]|nr:MAG: pantetheine-phosphate adenylyltransferase [Candidatus Coatesbacteria bacterium]